MCPVRTECGPPGGANQSLHAKAETQRFIEARGEGARTISTHHLIEGLTLADGVFAMLTRLIKRHS
jgi:hypothetical protein